MRTLKAIAVPTFEKVSFKFKKDNIFIKFSSLKAESYLKNTSVPFDWLIDHAHVLMIGA